MDERRARLALTIICPIFNEEENVGPLVAELTATLERSGREYELICVDDASTDRSLEVLKSLLGQFPCLRVLSHLRNSGQSAALYTGYRAARGEIVVTVDGDRQYNPDDVLRLVEHLEQSGADAVSGVRRRRQDNWIRRLSSRIANSYRNWITGDKIRDAGCAFRAVRTACLREIPAFNGMHRFLPTILRAQGYTVVELEVDHLPRRAGVAKYGIGNRLWRGLVDCLAMRWWKRRCFYGRRTGPELTRDP